VTADSDALGSYFDLHPAFQAIFEDRDENKKKAQVEQPGLFVS